MTIQEPAQIILEEVGKPISSKEVARIALDRRLVVSNAQDPVQSHAQAIEKNIRDGFTISQSCVSFTVHRDD
jgi:hypothetical protein